MVADQADTAKLDDLIWIRELLDGVFEIYDVTLADMHGRATRIHGRFLIETQIAYDRLAPLVRARGRTLMFRHDREGDVILIVQGVVRPTPNSKWLPLIFGLLTFVSVYVSALLMEGVEPTWASITHNLDKGWGFTFSLLGILLAHELGHYFVARHFGVAVTLPYLIPLPLVNPFGTMGAVIRMKDFPPSKRAALLIGAAGPIAGLLVAIPCLVVGLSLSHVEPLPTTGAYVLEGNSILYALLKFIVFGRWLPSQGMDVMLDPIAFAGWAGLLVTSFNLIPAAQLDGGHVAYALLADKARYLTWLIIGLLAVLGLIWWQGWLIWAALIFFVSRSSAPPLDDLTPLSAREIAVAVALLIVFALTFTPLPLQVLGS